MGLVTRFRDMFRIGDGNNPRADPIGYGSPEDAKRPRSTLRCFSIDWKWGQATEWSTPCRFAPRLVASNHNETCQGAYLRGHLKSDFYLHACRHRSCFALFFSFLFSFFFRSFLAVRGSSATRYHTVIPRYKWFRDLSRSKRWNDRRTVFYFYLRLSKKQLRETFACLSYIYTRWWIAKISEQLFPHCSLVIK